MNHNRHESSKLNVKVPRQIDYTSSNDVKIARFPESNVSQGACETLPGGLEPPTRAGTSREGLLPAAERLHIGSGNHGDSTGEDVVLSLLLNELGFYGKSFKREQRKAGRRFISEIYSPPRITQELKQGKYASIFEPGLALDLTTNNPDTGRPWDFRLESNRRQARELLRVQKPILLIGSPECTAYSVWQRLNEQATTTPEKYRRAKIEADVHMRFVCSLYIEQLERGDYFLHEHPMGASSWKLPCIQNIMRMSGVATSVCDQCQYGAQVRHGPH